VTRFSEFSLNKLYKKCLNRDDIEDIIKNISNVGFVQIGDIESSLTTYWYFNDYTKGVSFSDNARQYYLPKAKKKGAMMNSVGEL
jgi:hypothetical protein